MDHIQTNFDEFHQKNPRVYELFDRFTRQLINAGRTVGSAGLIAERIRWETAVATTSMPPVKLNNNYRSRYARLWMDMNPSREGFFRTRELRKRSIDAVDIPEAAI